MKKIYIHIMMLAALVVAGAAMTSCQKEEAVTGKLSMTVKATKGGGNTKALSLDPNNEHTLNATWAEGEQVTVYKGTTPLGTLTAQSDGDETTLYGTIESPSEDPIVQDDVLTLKFCSDNYNNQDGTLGYIAANCDYATATVTVTSVGDGKVNTSNSGKVEFENQQAIVKFTLLDKADDAAISPSALTVTDGTHTVSLTGIPAATYTANKATNVLFVAFPAANEAKTITLVANDGSDTYSYETASAKTFTNGRYYEITVKMEPAYFTVSANSANSTNSKVLFAPGNLQAVFATANNSSCTWQFATTQYSYIGNDNANTAVGNNCVTTAGTVDLFGWVSENSSLAAYGINNSITASDYGNTEGEALKSDWGVVANDANLGGHNSWRTLTNDEWGYLFEGRTNASQKYGHGSVNGVNGIIILPDVWVLPSGLSFTAGKSEWTNSYTIAQWEKMEDNGAVFLPAAGYRHNTNGQEVGSVGCYWSSTPDDNSRANGVYFESNDLTPQDCVMRRFGCSVRLARYVN